MDRWQSATVKNLSRLFERIDLDEAVGDLMDPESMPWFPRVAASSVTEGDSAPAGFISKVLHLRWDSLPMLLPDGDPGSATWWSLQSATWGQWPKLVPIRAEPTPSGWRIEFESHFAEILPLDDDGHGRKLAELNCRVLHTAIGGVQHEGRDVILLFEKENGRDVPLDEEHLRMIGAALGEFHALAATHLATPNDERAWNDHNAGLERKTRSATVWRGPHSADTQGTITHRNFGVSVCQLVDGEIRIGGCMGGVKNALIPERSPYPAIRDIGACYVTLHDQDPALRKALFEGWTTTVPKHWHSSRATDTHRGGTAIWEYEQMLCHRLYNQAWGMDEPAYVTHWLAGVSRIQNGMYQARTLSVAGLICFSIIPAAVFYWIFYPGSPSPTISDLGAMGALGICGILLRRMYRAAAPNPW
ncbi:MAG: hypothetical protein VX627_06125 [Candidatus Thermoplasmatota archaeon]|nr:hypothetical protein [Candidatus Thermoplasmatota archaeon]